MKINQYAGVLVMTLAVTAQTAYAAVVMQIDITDLSNVKFIATGANSQINDSGHLYSDGITLDNILTPGSTGEGQINGTLSASSSSPSGPYDTFEGGTGTVDFGSPLALYIYSGDSEENQVFTTGSPAFTGQSWSDFSNISFELEVVCDTGDIVAGYINGEVSEPIGQWQIIKTTVNCPPTNLSAAAGDGKAVINFDADPDNGSPITNYQYSFDDVIYIPLSPATASSPITITGLDNGRDYSITLQAVNSVGASAASAPVAVTPAIPVTPSAPQITNIDYGDTEIYISVSVANNGGSAITGYSATCTGGGETFDSTSTTTRITVSGLTNGVAYICRVKATNGQGPSAASAASPPITPEEAIAAGLPIWLLYEVSK